MPLDQGVVDGVSLTNFKALAEMPMLNAIGHQNRMNAIFEASIAQAVNSIAMSTSSVPESLGLSTAKESGLAAQVASLAAAVASMQIQSKIAGNTPPTTP